MSPRSKLLLLVSAWSACFVFPAAWVRDFIVSKACVGVHFVMRSLLFNVLAKTRRMLILRDAHLTYHYGDDRLWPESKEYAEHNVAEAKAILEALSADPASHKVLSKFCAAHGESLSPTNPAFNDESNS